MILGPRIANRTPGAEIDGELPEVIASSELQDYFRIARLNVAAGAADASRAMLIASCRKVELLTSIFAFL